MIRRSFIPAALVLALAATVCEAFAAPTTAKPTQEPAAPAAGPSGRLAFDAVSLNLGDIVRGQDAVATFTYRNTGNATLRILTAKPG